MAHIVSWGRRDETNAGKLEAANGVGNRVPLPWRFQMLAGNLMLVLKPIFEVWPAECDGNIVVEATISLGILFSTRGSWELLHPPPLPLHTHTIGSLKCPILSCFSSLYFLASSQACYWGLSKFRQMIFPTLSYGDTLSIYRHGFSYWCIYSNIHWTSTIYTRLRRKDCIQVPVETPSLNISFKPALSTHS